MIMSQKEILLSVCVPTYNQSAAVEKLLENLMPQYIPQIEIIVRDDSENNETEIIVSKFGKAVPIRYFRGKKEGLDAAIIFLTEEARGLFVWWIGDDVIDPGAIQRILSLIEEHKDLSFIWVNSHDIRNKDALTINDRRNYFFPDKNKILDIDIGLLGFITATVFKRELVIPGMTQARRHIGSAFVCMYIALYVIAQDGKCYYLGTPCFSSNHKPSGEVRWYDQFQVFGINLFHIVKEFESSFNKRQIRKALSKNLAMVVKAIIVERALGLKTGFASSSPKLIPMARLYWRYKEFWIFLPLLITPRFILKPFYAIYKKY
jgi:abequosyltransferase